jgi:alkylation response protein AidB-like acyl-CoA dehydrogenase
MRTTARRDGSDWVINGSKTFATAAAVPSTTILLYCKTELDKDPRKSMTVFLLPNDTPGLDIRKIRMLGRHLVPTTEIFLDNVRLPADAVLGEPGGGWKILLGGLQEERVSNPAAYVGNAQTVVDETLAYVKERQAFGSRLGDFQVIAHRIADMQTKVDAARLMTYRAAAMLTAGVDALTEVCMAKLFAGEVFVDVTNEGMQMLGGYGYTMEAPMQRHFRAARGCTITGGSSEMQRQTIARRLGLRPR